MIDLQDRLTESIVAAIQPRIQQAEVERVKLKAECDFGPYDFLLRAQECEYQFRKEGHDAALRHLEQALALDPSYARAMALAAFCYATRLDQGWMSDRQAETIEGLRLACHAIHLAKDDADIFWMAAYAIFRLQMDDSQAKMLIRQSLEINPNSATALAIAGDIESNKGNSSEALNLVSCALRMSPSDPRAWLIDSKMAWVYLVEGRPDKAVWAAQRVLNRNPLSAYALRFLASGLARQGHTSGARKAIQQLRKIEPDLTLSKLRGRLMFVEKEIWQPHSEALRRAGLPE